ADTPAGAPGLAVGMVLRCLATDAHRLPSADVVRLALQIRSSQWFDPTAHLLPLVECLLADPPPIIGERQELIIDVLTETTALVDEMSPEDCLRLLLALGRAHYPVSSGTIAKIDERLAASDFPDRMRDAPDLGARLREARERLPEL
ncbi:hypothetical protein AB0C29_49875, partial [Actinoplanes sp. NPDC048791]|uniref:hypothetical protein n=1 Tax=Actinoplanes sp. NPDC048791 TaxID=3154623 RepID=UPI0033C4B78A